MTNENETVSSSVTQSEAETQNEAVAEPAKQARPRRVSRDHSEPPPMVRDHTLSTDGMRRCKSFWEQKIENHEVDRLINPFSDFWGNDRGKYKDVLENAQAVWKGIDKRTRLTKADEKYGHVVEGTLTEKRGKKAKNFIAMNIIECCQTVKDFGEVREDGTYQVPFGKLFSVYERINDKLVGLLVRARRHGLLEFPGEMLYQGQDNNVMIKLIKIPTIEELNLKFITFDKPTEVVKEEERYEKPTFQ